MITLSLPCSTLSVHPPALPNDPPLLATITDVEPEDILRQMEIAEVVKYYGPQELLCAIGWENVKEHYDL